MDFSGAGAFVYAKASGILGKSFIGPRTEELFNQKSLGELWSLIFKTQPPLVPEVLLAQQIETEAFKKFLSQYTYFINQYQQPHKILIAQLTMYEAENLKEIVAALCAGETKCPELMDLGKFATLNVNAWPNLSAITAKTEFDWCNKVPGIHEQQSLETKIDMQVIKALWSAIDSTSGEEKEALLQLFKSEYVIKNIVWALRLRVHYQMEKEDIISRLIYVTQGPTKADPIAAPAIDVLDIPLDDYEAWRKWTYSELINPIMDNGTWQIDPTWIESKNKVRENKMALHIFHQYPMSICSLIGWYKIKNFELSCIRTAVESLRLAIPPQSAKEVAGIAENA